eukprot:TRINITY_DN35395_c0_g2_i1.p1 TRINITY_DN35395_c0_g2~~TRINITY_DN35395_c0_g2_i1.p1  ORF type:complete len:215 (-),score=51.70 TRINITY_DN35395_c0_g2_i1:125-769(-)
MGGSQSGMCCSDKQACCAKTDGSATIKVNEVVLNPKESADPETAKAAAAPAAAEKKEATGQDTEETYEDGSTYVGQVVEGRRHGRGVWTSPSEQYSGQWKLDQRDGQGRQTWSDGRCFEGQFSLGKFDGHGRMEWHTAHGLMVYEGQYVCDMKHGTGLYQWPDQRIYKGQWVQGKRSGKATYTNSNGDTKHGIWKDDRIEKWLDESEVEAAGGD